MGSGGESPADYLQRASVPSPALSSRGLAACRGAALLEPLLIVAFATWQQQASSQRSVASRSVSLPACLAAGLSPGLGHRSGDRQSPAAARREPALCLLLEAQMLFRSWMRAGVQRSQKKGVPSALGGQQGEGEEGVGIFGCSAQCDLLSPSRACHSRDAPLHEASPCHHRHAAGFHVPGEPPTPLLPGEFPGSPNELCDQG